jgi:hypothetical protein
MHWQPPYARQHSISAVGVFTVALRRVAYVKSPAVWPATGHLQGHLWVNALHMHLTVAVGVCRWLQGTDVTGCSLSDFNGCRTDLVITGKC